MARVFVPEPSYQRERYATHDFYHSDHLGSRNMLSGGVEYHFEFNLMSTETDSANQILIPKIYIA